MPFIDLSHAIEDGMPGFKMRDPDGNLTEYTARVRPFLTHEQSRVFYDGKAEFEITELTLQTSIGTYIDSPYHRHAGMRDIGQIELDEVILPGVVIDARGRAAWEAVDLAEALQGLDLRGKAVLINFGWDQYWGAEAYYAYPFISRPTIEALNAAGARLVGVDTLNIDSARDPERPAHTRLLAESIFIVENLCSLTQLYPHNEAFTFFAVPLRVVGAAAMPLRAFAMVQ
ncbi:MAG: cyclase family protein [Anaerolineae bacterium]|nr:cyclase family protein [Anaerolineae bacterium]